MRITISSETLRWMSSSTICRQSSSSPKCSSRLRWSSSTSWAVRLLRFSTRILLHIAKHCHNEDVDTWRSAVHPQKAYSPNLVEGAFCELRPKTGCSEVRTLQIVALLQ